MKEDKSIKDCYLDSININQNNPMDIENSSISSYKLFDHSLIAIDQHHVALDFTRNHLKKLLILNSSKPYESTIQIIADIHASEINIQNKIISLLEDISLKVLNELVLNTKVMDCIKEESREIETEMKKNDSNTFKTNSYDVKKQLLKIEKELLDLSNMCNNPDLQLSYYNLSITQDEFEKGIFTNLGKLIFSDDNIYIPALEKILKNPKELKSKMINIKNNLLSKEQLYFIVNTTNDIIYQIDPSKDGSNEVYLKYKHLLPYGNFIIKAVDYLLFKNTEKEIYQSLVKVNETKEANILNFQYLKNVKESLNFSDSLQTEQIELNRICTLVKDIKKATCKEFEILQNELTISGDYFKPLNSELKIEENAIYELYEVFNKIFQKDNPDQPRIRANISTQENKSRFRLNFCGMCFYWK